MLKQTSFVLLLSLLGTLLFAFEIKAQNALASNENLRGKNFQNITLEVSLKPFRKNDKTYIRNVAKEIFTQWQALLRHADTVSVLLWTADGSELLNYSGKLKQQLEWAKYMGNPNTAHPVNSGPESLTLHQRAYDYMPNPPSYTYADLKFIVATLREVGKTITGKPIRIGTTFDPGPEFAKSEFKYKKHPEILEGKAMGEKSFVFSYATLKKDNHSYAGYPNGIAEETPFGTFFGRQSQYFMTAMGFDYLWLSNGFGFGMEPWAATGTIFTGSSFNTNKLEETRQKIINFWTLFRKECPNFRLETRGTNLSTGIDLAKDGVDLRAIYQGGFNILPPPNSPWAAMDGDFGLEMVGYMSRIATVPNDQFLFRFYTHDPWWLNSPWLDRYGRQPHDIYLPMSVAMVNSDGKVCLPTHLAFLTIDNTLGELPKQVPDEVIPHILSARYDSPDAPGPFVWVYPFNEYHNWAQNQKQRLPEIYYGDWFIRQAINCGFPLNTVVSTDNFITAIGQKSALFQNSVLVSIVPEPGSQYEKQLIKFVTNGGKVMIYGPADHASDEFKTLIELTNVEPLEGTFEVKGDLHLDSLAQSTPTIVKHLSLFSGGGIRTKVSASQKNTRVLFRFEKDKASRDVAWVTHRENWKGGKIAYIRGTNSSHFDGGRLLTPDDPMKYFIAPSLMRHVMNELGYQIGLEKINSTIKNPVITIARANNAFMFSGYAPNTTVNHSFRLPQGIPLLAGLDTKIKNESSNYTFQTSWNKECRVFIEQKEGMVSVKEMTAAEKGKTRRIRVNGLKNATVRIYPESHITNQQIKFYTIGNPKSNGYPWLGGEIPFENGELEFGHHFKVVKFSGDLIVSW